MTEKREPANAGAWDLGSLLGDLPPEADESPAALPPEDAATVQVTPPPWLSEPPPPADPTPPWLTEPPPPAELTPDAVLEETPDDQADDLPAAEELAPSPSFEASSYGNDALLFPWEDGTIPPVLPEDPIDLPPVADLPPRQGPGRWPRPLVIGAAAVAVLLVLGTGVGVGVVIGHARRTAGGTTNPAVHAAPPPSVAAPVLPSSAPPSLSPSPDPDVAALARLRNLREHDLNLVALDGRYVAQLASKIVGIVDPRQTTATGSHTFYAADILAEHLALRRHAAPDAPVVLMLSTDFGSRSRYHGQPLWMTLALGRFPSADAVRGWCAARFPQYGGALLANRCLPRRLDPLA